MTAVAANTLAELTVPIRGDLTPLMRDMAAARREMEAFSKSMGGMSAANGNTSSPVGKLNRDMVAANDNAKKLANSLGAAGIGGGFNQLSGTVNKVSFALDDYTAKTNQAGAASDRLGAEAAGAVPGLKAEETAVEQNTMAKQKNIAVSKMAANQQRILAYQLVDVTQMLAMGQAPLMTLIQQGPQIAQIYGPNEGGLGRAFSESAKMVGGLIAKMPLLSASVLLTAGSMIEMRRQLKAAGHDAISMTDIIMGLFSTIGDYVASAFAPVMPIVSAVWEWLVSSTKTVGNEIIKSFQIVGNDLAFVFTQFPNIVAKGVEIAANTVITGIEWMINKAIEGLNGVIGLVNDFAAAIGADKAAEWLGMGSGKIPTKDPVTLGRTNSGTAGAELEKAAADRLREQQAILDGDPLGDFASDWRANSVEAMRERLAKKAGKGKKTQEDPFAKIVRDSQQFIAMQKLEADALGKTEEEAAKLRYEQELLNKAQDAGIKLTDDQKEKLKGLAGEMAAAEEQTRKLTEAYNFGKDTFKGFFTDFKSELMNGASIWEAFGTAAMNALNKIADKLLDMALNGLFDQLWGGVMGGSSGGSGGGGGGLLGWIGGLFGFANGTTFAPGGWSMVGEKGPELMKLPGGTEIVPNHRALNPGSFGASGQGASGKIEVEVFVRDDGTIGAIARQAGAEAGREQFDIGIRVYDQEQLPDSMERVSQNPRMR